MSKPPAQRSRKAQAPAFKAAPEDLKAGESAFMAGDYAGAAEAFRPLADRGDPEAQAWLGSMYAAGSGVAVNDEEAFRWYLQSAKGGNVLAQANVGTFYIMGKGVERNDREGVRWLRKAARAGDAHAQFNLAVLYAKGEAVQQDHAKAASLYKRAAENGHYPSQARLGHAYQAGVGVARNRVRAFMWLSLAAQHGIGTALQALDELVRQMSSDEKSKGLQMVQDWQAKRGGRGPDVTFQPVPG